jgi:Glycosyltransferases involved in cell wall biogenesis
VAEISVLVPVCNVEKYLNLCLDSILAQTFTDLEIICIDDGSSDKSGCILDEYARKDARIKVIHKANSGYGQTMNIAVSLASGKYIGIVESDDTIDKDMYQTLYDYAAQYDLDFVKTDHYATWDNDDGTIKKQYIKLTDDDTMYNRVLNPNEELRSYFLQKFTWNALYKREFLINNHIKYNETPGASYQDNGFWFQTFYWSERVMFLNRAFYNYRQDNENSSIHSKQKVYAMKDEYDFIRDIMVTNDDKREELYHICFHLRMLAYLLTLGRIDMTLKPEFARVIERECSYFEENKEVCYDWLTDDQLRIIKNPVGYIEDDVIGCRNITKEVIAEFGHIIVYGAGSYGERIVCRVKLAMEDDRQSMQVAVTNLNSSDMECLGEKVYEITDCVKYKDNSLVIVAVKESSSAFYDMLDCLRKLGFSHIISVSARKL